MNADPDFADWARKELAAEIPKLHERIAYLDERLQARCAQIDAWRLAMQRIYALTEGSADGAPDASEHDRLCNEITAIVLKALGPEGVK